MRRTVLILALLMALYNQVSVASSDVIGEDRRAEAETVPEAVRVTIIRLGGRDRVSTVSDSSSSSCDWSASREASPGSGDFLVIGTGPELRATSSLYALFCNGRLHSYTWVDADDVIDVDAAAAAEAQRYVEDVVRPVVTIGANPDGRGLAGLASWFWIEGFTGSVSAPPISAFGLTVEVRMSSGSVTWDFGDGTVESGDLGRAYPAESTVQHRHQVAGPYTVTATIALRPEYRVDGGAWITLPSLATSAATTHVVEQRQAVVTEV